MRLKGAESFVLSYSIISVYSKILFVHITVVLFSWNFKTKHALCCSTQHAKAVKDCCFSLERERHELRICYRVSGSDENERRSREVEEKKSTAASNLPLLKVVTCTYTLPLS
ncbi:hypothetical protein QOT17_002071 [Balamuthia mandrillaris]